MKTDGLLFGCAQLRGQEVARVRWSSGAALLRKGHSLIRPNRSRILARDRTTCAAFGRYAVFTLPGA
jgi:hypothetical protein